jgi:hypothetical protein
MMARALALIDALTCSFGPRRWVISAQEMIGRACTRSGLRDFGDLDVAEPLRRLLQTCAEEAQLSLIGQYALRWDVLRLLSIRCACGLRKCALRGFESE